jgi:uncharacterized protein (DUF885 family)
MPPPSIDEQPVSRPKVSAEHDVGDLFEQYFLGLLDLNPRSGTALGMQKYNNRWVNFLGEEHRTKTRNFYQGWADRLAEINPEHLEEHDRTSLEILKYSVALAIEGERFPTHLMPVNQFYNFASGFVQSGSGLGGQPFSNYKDYMNWHQRARGIPVVIDQAIENMRIGMERGLVQPRVLMKKVLPQLSAHIISDPEQSVFWQPVSNLPGSLTDAERQQIRDQYRDMILQSIVPAYTRLHEYIRDEYLPQTRESAGMSGLPDGSDWYQYRIKQHTTTDLTATEIHQIGLQEVARILAEMNGVRISVGFAGSLEQFFTYLETDEQFYWQNDADLIAGYEKLQQKINGLLPQLFDVFPQADYEVRAVEPFRAQSAAGASYQRASPDGSRAGVFYVNTYNLKAQPKFGMETLSLHEASPGHHFQITIQQEIQNLPKFRAYGGFTVFTEGWALYAESLGKDLGLFTDPYQYFGRLSDEMLRAMRLVVDTGLHAKGWTREEAIQYMLDNSTLAESDVIAEVERYMAIPGQALSYKIGQRMITDIRAQAEQRLGAKFDVRHFHKLVLTGGAMPIDLLAARVNRWVEAEI